MQRLRRIALVAAFAALTAGAPAALGDLEAEKQSVDAEIGSLQAQVATAKGREHVLTSDIAAAGEQIDAIQGRVDLLGAAVARLEARLGRHRATLARLRDRLDRQTRLVGIAQEQERIAKERLESRLVDLYQNDPPGTIEILFSVSSLNDLVSRLEYAQTVARRDREIAAGVALARRSLEAARALTAALRAEEARTTAALAAETLARQRALDEIVARRDQLAAAQADREELLQTVRSERAAAEEEIEDLRAASAELADRIRSAQSTPSTSTGPRPASASGLVWPVDGPITSGFGMRWGRMHEGVDIGVGAGTPIRAAAAGTVIYAGWMGGYGNLVVIDHGGGLATAYGHQQRIYVGVGQGVGQGETIGEVGSTGHSTGPHLHFEVRANGTPVDPLGYL